jgi:hypothetical protein
MCGGLQSCGSAPLAERERKTMRLFTPVSGWAIIRSMRVLEAQT